jgi:2-amino-4-hydroxy-6-hydroxymethyldihydropteridine diphosphokinase
VYISPVAAAYIALGGNLGDRRGYLSAAARALAAATGVSLVARSPLYETEAVADEEQPRYLNAVVRVETALDPRALLALCLQIERSLGRHRPPGRARAPRTIDLDLLLHEQTVLDEPGLRLPHPELLRRPFVRIPLARVAEPGLRHPQTAEPLDSAPPHPDVRKLDESW